MGLLHIPRVAVACARGYLRGRAAASAVASDPPLEDGTAPFPIVGVGSSNPHTYKSFCGVFDIDLNLHMNHSAYLTHCELARWEMMARNGALSKMIRDRCALFVTGCAVRYRKEIGPLYRPFLIRTHVASIDRRNMWLYHTFRYPEGKGKAEGKGKESRVLAQVLVQGVCVKDKTVVSPATFLEGTCGVDPETVAHLLESCRDDRMREKRSRFEELEEALRASAASDDDDYGGRVDGP